MNTLVALLAATQIHVVAAENFWGSLASQLGGNRVQVTSVITNPATDPHDYEPSAVDARTMAGAQMAIVNGVGYDPWAPKLHRREPGQRARRPHRRRPGRRQGRAAIRTAGTRRSNVQTGDRGDRRRLLEARPEGRGVLPAQKSRLETKGLAQYKNLIATIKRRYHGVAVGASESIFAPLAQALGLNLITPYSFLKAISEGTEPTAADKTTIDRQIAKKQIKVWVFNSQNSTPDVAAASPTRRARRASRSRRSPRRSRRRPRRFQQWQVAAARRRSCARARDE